MSIFIFIRFVPSPREAKKKGLWSSNNYINKSHFEISFSNFIQQLR